MSEAAGNAAVNVAEAIVFELDRRLNRPEVGECLYCYVDRMLDEHGCDATLKWATRFRDLRAPRATALEDRLRRRGGFCDCEIFLNAVRLIEHAQRTAPDWRDWWDDCGGCDDCRRQEDELEGGPVAPCRTVRAGSTQHCGLWARSWTSW